MIAVITEQRALEGSSPAVHRGRGATVCWALLASPGRSRVRGNDGQDGGNDGSQTPPRHTWRGGGGVRRTTPHPEIRERSMR